MPNVEQTDLRKKDFVTLKNSITGDVLKVIFPNGIQVGISGTDSFNKGIVLSNTSVPPTETTNALYAVGGDLYFDGSPVGGTPGGSDTQVQFNDGGSFGGDSGLTYNKTTDTLSVAGDLTVNGGDLTSTATTFNLLNSTVTTLNVGGAATVINAGAATAVATVGKSEHGTFTDGASAYFAHKDATVTTGYALFQADPAGSKNTWVNAPTGGRVYIANADNALAYLDDNEIALTGKSGTAQTVTVGSTVGASSLTLQAGTGGVTITGNLTVNGGVAQTYQYVFEQSYNSGGGGAAQYINLVQLAVNDVIEVQVDLRASETSNLTPVEMVMARRRAVVRRPGNAVAALQIVSENLNLQSTAASTAFFVGIEEDASTRGLVNVRINGVAGYTYVGKVFGWVK